MARWDAARFSAELETAVDSYDYDAAESLCTRLIGHLRTRVDVYPEEQARRDLATLRRRRQFRPMARVGDAFIRSGLTAPEIRRQYAQALLDQGDVTAGLAVLEPILYQRDVPPEELAEVRGLMGRAHKQVYVDAGDSRPPRNREALRRAIDCYQDVYQSDRQRYLWQGVNAATLLIRGRRDGVDFPDLPDGPTIAREILEAIESRDRGDEAPAWDLATAAEACVAVGDCRGAGTWLRRYVERKRPDGRFAADVFELASTTRQFEEVIQLDQDEGDEAALMDLLRAHLVAREGGGCRMVPNEVAERAADPEGALRRLEKVLGVTKYQPHRWLMEGLRRASGVARIWRRGGRGAGTGFLLPGSVFPRPAWATYELLLTNNHVISTTRSAADALKPNEVDVTFDALAEPGPEPRRYRVAEVLWESPYGELDTTIVRLDAPVGAPAPPIEREIPDVTAAARVYLIGHPLGGELAYSLQDNKLLARSATRIQYRSPTDPGSSGSPLFNQAWDLIGLHHAGSREMPRLDDPTQTHPANEGIPIAAVIGAVAG